MAFDVVIGEIEGFEDKFPRPEILPAVNKSLEFRSDPHCVYGRSNGKAVALQDLFEKSDRIVFHYALTGLVAGIAAPAG